MAPAMSNDAALQLPIDLPAPLTGGGGGGGVGVNQAPPPVKGAGFQPLMIISPTATWIRPVLESCLNRSQLTYDTYNKLSAVLGVHILAAGVKT